MSAMGHCLTNGSTSPMSGIKLEADLDRQPLWALILAHGDQGADAHAEARRDQQDANDCPEQLG